jgi:hypothetical protein
LAKANLNGPILNAIADHANVDVSLKALRLLVATGESAILDQLRELAQREGVCDEVKTALLEAIYNLEHPKPTRDEVVVSKEIELKPTAEDSEEATLEGRSGSGLPIAFVPTSEAENKAESKAEVEFQGDRLEL